jgi:DNA-binding GntR family transcriptional regulator
MKREPSPDIAAAEENRGTSLRQKAYGVLKAMIEEGKIRPGERLLEAQVVKAFGISRSPARQALEALSRDRLIIGHDRRGYLVAGAGDTRRPAHLKPVRLSQPRQWERIYSEVEQDLLAGILFGSVRINDHKLAQHYDVSRTVTRDLLARMHGIGLISKDRHGHWISERVTPERIRHLYEVRALLEPATLRQAAPFIPKGFLAKARDHILTTLADSPIDSSRFDQVETDLHIDVLGHAPNKEVLHALRRSHLLFGPTRHLLDPILGIPLGMIEDALNEHLIIIDHLIANRAEDAARALQAHLNDAIARWMGRFEAATRICSVKMPPYLVPFEDNS